MNMVSIRMQYFCLKTYLYNANKTRNKKIANRVNDALIYLKNSINRTEIPKSEDPDEVTDIFKEILNFNKQ